MAETVQMPKLGFDMAEGTLVRWVKAEGEKVAKGEILAEIETDKATVEVESAYEGIVYRHLVEEGSIVPVGKPIAVISQPGEEVKDVAEPASASTPKTETAAFPPAPQAAAMGDAGSVFASPVARRIADELKVDLRQVKGTGPGGRIVRRDVEKFQPEPPPGMPEPGLPAPAPAPIAQQPKAALRGDETVPVDRLRLAIGRRMAESKQQVPHFYVTHEYDLDALLALRSELNQYLADEEKLSVNDFIVKAAALTLRQFPALNASLAGEQILRHGAVNIGVAVAVEGGLLTVVVRDADSRPLRAISADVKAMAGRVRQGKVKPDDIEGSTFSISNLGMFDVENFAAIINPPEAAILAVGSAKPVPAIINGEIQVRTRMKITISADHRLVDGVQAAQFMKALADFLEKPARMLL